MGNPVILNGMTQDKKKTVMLTWDLLKKDLKLAVSGNTVYVGKRDGKLDGIV